MSGLQALVAVCLLGWVGVSLPSPLVGGIFALNALSAAVWAYDKLQAQAQRARVPESALHVFAIIAGPGAAMARQFFRHKTQKATFGLSAGLGLVLTSCLLFLA